MRAKLVEITFEPQGSTARPAERTLAIVLRSAGTVLLLAFCAVLLPARWMAAIHKGLTMGEFPSSPLVDYLTRSISGLYALKGGLYWVLATDVRRYAPVIRYVAWSTILFGLAIVVVDLRAQMPWFWTLGEGSAVATVGVLFLLLLGRLPPGDSR